MNISPGPSGSQTLQNSGAIDSEDEEYDGNVKNTSGIDSEDEEYDEDDVTYETESEVEDPDYETNPPEWSDHDQIGMKSIPFTREERFLTPVPEVKSPINFFKLLVDTVFLEGIVAATNKYAFELICKPSTVPGSRPSKWKDLTEEELLVFIGLLLHMGFVKLPRIQDYWKNNKLFASVFPNFMTRDRFLTILRCINFELHPDPSSRSSKVRFLVDYFNDKMKSVYYPQKNLCIDEAVLWRGRLHCRQHVKGKRHKYGIKLYSLCDPHGLILKFFVYCGELQDFGGRGHAANVVLNIMQEKLNCGHSLYMDDYYNSFSLSSFLLRRNTYTTGALRLDRKYISKKVKSAKLKKGETISEYADGVMVGKWRDKEVVSYISTEHSNELLKCLNRIGVERMKPLPIVKYNQFMKCVDRSDRILSYYPCERKTVRWYKKIFIHVVQMLMINAHYLFNEVRDASGESKMQLYDFHLAVVDGLLPEPARPPRPLKRKRIPHVPSKIEEKQKSGSRLKNKRCRVCSGDGIVKRVTWHCLECDGQPGLCVPHCFDKYHD